MLSFQSPFEENEMWINCKAPIFCLLKIISFLIIAKSAENLKHEAYEFSMTLFHPSILLNFSMNSEVFSPASFLEIKIKVLL